MNRRDQWRPVFDAEVKKWSAKSWAEHFNLVFGALKFSFVRPYVVQFSVVNRHAHVHIHIGVVEEGR